MVICPTFIKAKNVDNKNHNIPKIILEIIPEG